MARALRLEYPGAVFHVYSRGNRKQDIFRDDADRTTFLDMLGECVTRFHWILTAYTLMPNHFHLVMELTRETLSKGMQWLNGKYAQAFNRRHNVAGHLLQGPFKSPLIDKETYFLELLRYVVLNPVRACIVKRPENYRWSSHRAVLGQVRSPEWLAVDDVLAQFAPDRDRARAAYETFVLGAIGMESHLWKNLVARTYLGSEIWLGAVHDRLRLKLYSDDHPRCQRAAGAAPMSTIVETVARTFCTDAQSVQRRGDNIPRMIAAWIGRNESFMTNREIAAGLRIRSSGHVSDVIRRCEKELDRNPLLRTFLDRSLSTLRRKDRDSKL